MYSYKIKKVNGLVGAKAYSIPPNSSILLMDVVEPVIYLLSTDELGLKTVTMYYISEKRP